VTGGASLEFDEHSKLGLLGSAVSDTAINSFAALAGLCATKAGRRHVARGGGSSGCPRHTPEAKGEGSRKR
jgi:hypothetical protein